MGAVGRLSHLLLLSHVGLVLLLALLLLATGAGVIRASLEETARARASQSATEAVARLKAQQREVAMVAGLLAERPTLHRYLRQHQRLAAGKFLDTFRQTARLQFVSVGGQGATFAQAGDAPPDAARAGVQYDPDGRRFWLVAATTDEPPSHRIVVARVVPYAALASPDAGDVEIGLVTTAATRGSPSPRAGHESDDGDQAEILDSYRHVRATGRGETVGPLDDAAIVRIEPVRGADGDIEALVVATLPGAALQRQSLGWLLAFTAGCLGIVALAAAVAVWLSRKIARPFSELAQAAERLGVGDLETPVTPPATDLSEHVALARNLESMRRQVRTLTESERRQRQELDTVLDSVGDGIVAVDRDDVIRYANRQFLALSGRPAQEVLGAAFMDILPPATSTQAPAQRSPQPLSDARRTGLSHVAGTYRIGGQSRQLVVRSSAPIGGRQVAIVREETPAEASRSIRDAILANLSHEFQTPLAAQMASIELLQDHLRGCGDVTASRLVDAQYRGTLRLTQLVDNLLDSVRMENGEMRLRREPVDLVRLVEEAVELMRPLVEQRDQRVVLKLPGSRRAVNGDSQRLSQVAINLLANANKFAPDHSAIWVDLVWGEDTVSLWIEDEGPGLPAMASRADLFAPFRRAPDEEPSQRGTGLGLAIVRALVERHQGEVVIAEPQRRRGARFGVVLPLEALCES